jgi:hypothetical protein
MPITGNVGEWSEIYTLLKVLGDKNLFAGDEHFQRIQGLFYPIIKVLRTESNGEFEYTIDKNIVLISSNGHQLISMPVADFALQAKLTLAEIVKKKKQKSSTFTIPSTEAFMKTIHCSSLKASSSAKTDITIVIHDKNTNQTPELGFSIKSQLGNPSTLLNAGKTTNFKFTVNGLSTTQIDEVNKINTRNKIIDRLAKIEQHGGIINFNNVSNNIFSNNLILIDSLLPNIIAEILFKYYSTSDSTVEKLLNVVERENPLNFDVTHKHQFYVYKVKKFLTDAALGMMPGKVWSGQYDATGGYLVVKSDGDVVCYHLYNRNEFEQYLFSNTKLETASSSRHDFGLIYDDNGNHYINLNLQIRFIK